MKINESIKVPSDNDDFYEYECVHCEKIFRLNKFFFNTTDKDVLYCPYCGLREDIDRFYTTKFIEHKNAIAENYVARELNKQFSDLGRDLKNSVLSISITPIEEELVEELTLTSGIELNIKCSACDEIYKIEDNHVVLSYCPYCGEIQ